MTSSPFAKMPEELLVIIMEHVYAEEPPHEVYGQEGDHHIYEFYHPLRWCRNVSYPNLKHLRLACREYAYLPRLLGVLFEGIKLVASPGHLELHQIDLTKVKPYARRVVFDPEAHSSAITHDLDLDKLRLAWTATLTQLKGVDRFYIKPVEETVYSAILASLKAAGVVVTHLYLKHHTSSKFGRASDGELALLDLSNLETLVFNPQIDVDWEENFGFERPDDRAARRSGDIVAQVLKRCSHSIRSLAIGERSGSYITWPPPSRPFLEPAFTLPNMHDLCFGPLCHLQLGPFAAFLSTSCPALVRLTLNGSTRDHGVWRNVWDAIREHPCRMNVELQDLPCGEEEQFINFSHFTGEESHEERFDEPFDDIQYSLAMYLSRKIEWDDSLELWFDGEDE